MSVCIFFYGYWSDMQYTDQKSAYCRLGSQWQELKVLLGHFAIYNILTCYSPLNITWSSVCIAFQCCFSRNLHHQDKSWIFVLDLTCFSWKQTGGHVQCSTQTGEISASECISTATVLGKQTEDPLLKQVHYYNCIMDLRTPWWLLYNMKTTTMRLNLTLACWKLNQRSSYS